MQQPTIVSREATDRRAPWVAPEAEPFSLSDAETTSNVSNADATSSTFQS